MNPLRSPARALGFRDPGPTSQEEKSEQSEADLFAELLKEELVPGRGPTRFCPYFTGLGFGV